MFRAMTSLVSFYIDVPCNPASEQECISSPNLNHNRAFLSVVVLLLPVVPCKVGDHPPHPVMYLPRCTASREENARVIARTRTGCRLFGFQIEAFLSSSFPPASVRQVLGGAPELWLKLHLSVLVLVLHFLTPRRYKGSCEAGLGALENAAVLFTNYHRFSA